MIYTVGHSTRSFEEFLQILRSFGIRMICDVRTLPGSKRHPHFCSETLGELLKQNNIGYVHLPLLGGFRKTSSNSINGGWRHPSFRGYADYMQTDEFHEGLNRLIKLSKSAVVSIMCCEAVPWRCHRSLISDALVARGIKVEDLMSKNKKQTHHLTSFAKINGVNVTYPSSQLEISFSHDA